LAHQTFAVAVAVGQRGVDEIQTQFDGAAQRSEGFLIHGATPLLLANAPSSEADLTDP
jgi:hypothetical protein